MAPFFHFVPCYINASASPSLSPPSLPLLGLHTAPSTSPTPSRGRWADPPAEGSGPSWGCWTLNCHCCCASDHLERARKKERKRDRDGHGRAEGEAKVSNINKDCMEKMKSEELMKVKWWRSRKMHEWGQKEKDKQAVWAGIIFIQLHHYRGRVWGMPL